MSEEWQVVGRCVECEMERDVYRYKGKWYCWQHKMVQEDYDNSAWIERGYKKLHRLLSHFKQSD